MSNEGSSIAEGDIVSSDPQPKCEITSNPSKVIKYFEKTIVVDDAPIKLDLVTMKRSFLLVISNGSRNSLPINILEPQKNAPQRELTREELIRGFMDSNSSLKGLSLAISGCSTCIKESDNSLSSATLASRLSKKLNADRPVYVANNIQLPHDSIDSGGLTAKLYLKIFQFVQSNYDGGRQEATNCDNKEAIKTSL